MASPARRAGPVVARTLLIVAVVLVLRLPFLNQAVQGDDVLYLDEAEHAQIEPLHPMHTPEMYRGQLLDMRGHSHPPLNAWILGGLLAVIGNVKEVPFHLAYTLFSLAAALAMWSLAQRFSARPLIATLIFCAVPAFVVNGNSFETDVPFLAFWMAAVALFVRAVDVRSGWALAGSCAAAALAGLTSYQSVFLTPVLGAYLLISRKDWKPAWMAAVAAPLTLGAWQLFERATSGAMPATVLAGYLSSFHLESVTLKTRAAAALLAHLGWMASPLIALAAMRAGGRWRWIAAAAAAALAAIYDPNPLFWLSIGCGVWWLASCTRRDFLCWWVLIFFVCGIAVFYAPSARYLLPLAAPLAILAADAVRPRIAAAAIAIQFAVSLSLSVVNYQHWDAYRQFAKTLEPEAAGRRVWINSELGFRHYLEQEGGIPLAQGQTVDPGDLVVTSELLGPLPLGTPSARLSQREIRPSIPLRMISLNGRSAYSAISRGLLPFEISSRPIDEIRADIAVEPRLTYVDPRDPAAAAQLLDGVFPDGWTSAEGKILLKVPDSPPPIQVKLYLPPASPARHVRLAVSGGAVAETGMPAPGVYTLETNAPPGARSVVVTISVDKTFRAPGDVRDLGLVLTSAGFRDR